MMRYQALKKTIAYLLTAAFIWTMIAGSVVPVRAEGSALISEFCITAGKNAIDQLENNGYTAIYQNLNPSGGEKLCLGYKLGSNPLTGLLTSSEYQETIVLDGVTYTPVSAISLNQNAGGSPVYLYCTRDPKAGSGIVSLTMVRETAGEEDPMDFLNDGSVPVRNTDGSPADFEAGIAGYDLHCFMIRENICLPYISELKTVTAADGEDLFAKLVSSGCDYYEEQCIASGNGVSTYLCCSRTADADKAVRTVLAADTEIPDAAEYSFLSAGAFQKDGKEFELFYSKDARCGEPLMEVSGGMRMADAFTTGDWAHAYFEGRATAARVQLFGEAAYQAFAESLEPCLQLPVHCYETAEENTIVSETGMYLIRTAAGQENFEPEFAALEETAEDETAEDDPAEKAETGDVEESDPEETGNTEETENSEDAEDGAESLASEESVSEENIYENDGLERDVEDPDALKTEETEPEEEQVSGSVIGVGNMIAIAVMAMAAVAGTFVFAVLKNRRQEESEKE